METKKRDYEQKSLKRSCYNNRKECIKKKTMELATLCGIDACTVVIGPRGGIESWPENPSEAKAIINKFKDLTSNPFKKTTVRDESVKKVVDAPAGEVVSCQENMTQVKGSFENFRYLADIPCQRTTVRDESTKKVFAEPDGEVHDIPRGFVEEARIVNLAKMVEKRALNLRRSSLIGYQECLKQVDSKLEALAKRIKFLRTDQEYEKTRCCMENKQLEYSEKNKRLYCQEEKSSPKRRKVSQEPFLFDLNFPPPEEPGCSSLSFEDCNVLPNLLRIG